MANLAKKRSITSKKTLSRKSQTLRDLHKEQQKRDKEEKDKNRPAYRKIKRNRDESGAILTYTTTNESGITFETNTLKEARVVARIIKDSKSTVVEDAEKLLKELNNKKD